MWCEVLAVVAAVVVAALGYNHYKQSFWSRCGVPVVPRSLPFLGHMLSLMKKKGWLSFDKIYKHHGGDKVVGLYEFLRPNLLVGDPELVKAVLVRDFDHFVDRPALKFTTERDEFLNEILTMATGDHWKGIRSVLSPSFTSGRLKTMFPLVENKADELVAYINRKIQAEPALQLKNVFGLYTLEVISSCAFGMETNTLATDGDSVFSQKVNTITKNSIWRIVKFVLFMFFPWVFRVLKISISHPENTFFKEVVEETIRTREKGEKRGDFLDIMMEAREEQEDPNAKTPKYKISNKTVVANSFLFILAGYDTTATTMSLIAFQLARHRNYQDTLRQELRNIIKEHGSLIYQGVMEAKLLEAVFNETLRMHPTAHVTQRRSTKDYRFREPNFVLPAGTVITVPIWSLHHDSRYWEAPGTFMPERFFPENKDKLVPGTYLPFGLGPRNCIGMRFALMEAKLALAKILLNFELRCIAGEEELQFDPVPGLLRAANDTRLIFTPLN